MHIGETKTFPKGEVDIDGGQTPDGSKSRMRWAALIKRVFEVDPLECPECGGEAGALRPPCRQDPKCDELIARPLRLRLFEEDAKKGAEA